MYHHPTVSRQLVQARQQDELRSAATRRLAAEAKRARAASRPVPGSTLPVPAVRPARVPQLRKLLTRLLPA
jgi:hypothetical protein